MQQSMKSIHHLFNIFNKYRGRTMLALVLFLLGCAVGWLARMNWEPAVRDGSSRGTEIRAGGYTLINPLLECELAGDSALFKELRPFKTKVEALLKKKTDDYRLSHVSVYFRDLNNGPWFGINEDEKFSPASLLKVPTMIACLKQAENDRGFLAKRIRFAAKNDYNSDQMIKPSRSIEHGKVYTINELLNYSISYSDNNANTLLFQQVDSRILSNTYRDLGVEAPLVSTRGDFMPVTMYASFFRVLFNASYLGREMSHQALTYLTRTDFHNGIVAGVPPAIRVAHKFGERVLDSHPKIKQLHDCGIVYYPNNPYLLCIMSRGTDFKMLDDIISDTSRLVYEEVDQQHRAR